MPDLDDPGPVGSGGPNNDGGVVDSHTNGGGAGSGSGSPPGTTATGSSGTAIPGRRQVDDNDWTDGATDQAIAIAIEQRDKENPPGEGDSISGSLIQMDGGESIHRT